MQYKVILEIDESLYDNTMYLAEDLSYALQYLPNGLRYTISEMSPIEESPSA